MASSRLQSGDAFKICILPLNPPVSGLLISTNLVYDSDVSRASQLSAHIYLRALPQSRSSSSNDIYLGGIKVNPVFDEKVPLFPYRPS